MWAPDVHKVKPSSALLQLVAMFGAVGLFAAGVYEMRALAPMLPRAYPHDGLVKELSGQTDDASFAVSPCPVSLSLSLPPLCVRQAHIVRSHSCAGEDRGAERRRRRVE